MPDRLFICYRRNDTRDAVGRLTDDLRDHVHSDRIYRDVVSARVGGDWVRQIEEALERSAVLLAVIGSRWLEPAQAPRIHDPSDSVRMEIATALQRGIPIVPVLIEDAVVPEAGELPDELRPLTRIQARRMTDADWPHHLSLLLEDLKRNGLPLARELRPRGTAWDRINTRVDKALLEQRAHSRSFSASPRQVHEAVTAVLGELSWTVPLQADDDALTTRFSFQLQRSLPGRLGRTRREIHPNQVAAASVRDADGGEAEVALEWLGARKWLRPIYLGLAGATENRLANRIFDNVERFLAGEALDHSSPIPGLDRLRG